MTRYLIAALLARLRSGPILFALTVLGVAVGVAAAVSIQVINLSALGAFSGSVRAVSGEADLSVMPRGPALPEETIAEVLAVPGVATAWPLVRAEVSLEGSRLFLDVVGFDLLSPVTIPWEGQAGEIASALAEPGWAAVSPELAERRGWVIGDRFEVSSGSRRASLLVGALVDFGRLTPLAGPRLVVMDIAQVQGLLGRRGELLQVDVVAAEGTAPAELGRRLEERLGDRARVRTPEQRERRAEGLLGAFRLNLTALSLISLFVGGFLIYSSTLASLARRRRELGLLRSIGATRGQVLGLILGEVTLLGLLGVALGLPLGYLAARANVERVSATLSNIYLLEEIDSLSFPAWLVALALVLGMLGAWAGALLPALDMGRRDTRSLLAAFTLQERLGALAAPLFAGAWLLLGGTGVWYLVRGHTYQPAGFVLGIALLAALPLMAPLIVREVSRRVRVRRFSLAFGFRGTGRRLPTTAMAVAALAVAVSMLVGVTLMIGSFRRTVEIWLDGTVRADLYVTSETWSRARGAAALDGKVVEALSRHPAVAAIDRLRQVFTEVEGRRISVLGVDMGLRGGASRFALIEGEPAEALRRAVEEGEVLIGEPLARRAGLSVGGRVGMAGRDGPTTLAVAGVYYDYGSEQGSLAMDLDLFEQVFGPGPLNNLALYLEPGVEVEAVRDELLASRRDAALRIRSERRLREDVMGLFDQTFAVSRLLQLMSLVVAASGITLTLLVLARERVSELALFRALGARRRQIFRVFLGQGLGLAALGTGLGLAGGLLLALILIFLINRSYFGWTIALHWPWAALAQEVLLILAAALLASLYPALRASRTPASELSREDL